MSVSSGREDSDVYATELLAEQGYIDWAYSQLRAMERRIESMSTSGDGPKAGAALARHKQRRLDALAEASRALVIGRMDLVNDETWYIGKTHVDGDGHVEVAVVDWRAPIAERFYQASRRWPAGIGRRRTFKMSNRTLISMSEELLTRGFVPPVAEPVVKPAPSVAPRPPLAKGAQPAPPPIEVTPVIPVPELPTRAPRLIDEADLRAGDLILDELALERTGRMQEVVATIQADQDALIRAPLDGILAIQGGPGTGKTVVGLHRAAYVLYQQRKSKLNNSVLVVGPNPLFIDYISGVLPSLGESDARHASIADLALMDLSVRDQRSVTIRGTDSDDVRQLKGDARFAEVIRRTIWSSATPAPITVPVGTVRLALDEIEVSAAVASIEREGGPFQEARARLRDVLLSLLEGVLADRLGEQTQLRRDPKQLEDALDAELKSSKFPTTVFPDLNPRTIIDQLLTDEEQLGRAARGLFSRAQQRALIRKRAQSGRTAWTPSDLPLVAEAAFVLSGRPTIFGHVVVDEAQDLSPMEWRMVLRRSRRRSLTILGDLAQATQIDPPSDWTTLLRGVGIDGEITVTDLQVGYRVPEPILSFANRLLPTVAPQLSAPTSIRPGEQPTVLRVSPSQLGPVLARAVDAITEGKVAVIAPPSVTARLMLSFESAGVLAMPASEGLDHRVVVLSPSEAKGLEFDHVFVIEPRALAGRTRRGLRLLFIALTRATRTLTVIHAEPLPRALLDPAARPPKPTKRDPVDDGPTEHVSTDVPPTEPRTLTAPDVEEVDEPAAPPPPFDKPIAAPVTARLAVPPVVPEWIPSSPPVVEKPGRLKRVMSRLGTRNRRDR